MKKKIFSLIICIFLLALMVGCKDNTTTETAKPTETDTTTTTTVTEPTLKGSGTEVDPYLVESGDDLKLVVEKSETVTGYYKLVNNISYNSIQSEDYLNTIFNGNFNGNNKTITLGDVVISDTGIFYSLGEDSKVYDLKIVGHIDVIKGTTGALANFNEGMVENISTYGTTLHWNTSGTVSNGYADGIYSTLGLVGDLNNVKDKSAGAGGIVGYNGLKGIIKNCYNNMNVRAVVGGGGMCAINYGLIENCINNGCIGTTGDTASNMFSEFDFSDLGGMSGINYGTINECGNVNKVYAQRLPWVYTAEKTQTNYRMNIGGIAGDNKYDSTLTGEYSGGIITSCFNYGRIHGDTRIGGIAGQSNGTIKNCFNSCYIGGRYRVGGIVGYQKDDDAGTVDACMSLTRVKSSQTSTTIQDEDGVSYTVEALADGKTTANTATITEFYCLSKYATHSIYHNNSGNIAPIDNVNEETTNGTTTAAGKATDRIDVLGVANTYWSSTDTPNSYIPFNNSWQVTLNVYLSWQKAQVTFTVDGVETVKDELIGVNVFDVLEVSQAGLYSKANSNNNMSGIAPETGAPSVTIPDGKTLVWVTTEGDITTIWDGVVRSDIKVYAMFQD